MIVYVCAEPDKLGVISDEHGGNLPGRHFVDAIKTWRFWT